MRALACLENAGESSGEHLVRDDVRYFFRMVSLGKMRGGQGEYHEFQLRTVIFGIRPVPFNHD